MNKKVRDVAAGDVVEVYFRRCLVLQNAEHYVGRKLHYRMTIMNNDDKKISVIQRYKNDLIEVLEI